MDSETNSKWSKRIGDLAYNYDQDGLDHLHTEMLEAGASNAELEELAQSGYLGIFWDLCYAHACNKLEAGGLELLLPLLDKAHRVTGQKYLEARVDAFHILLEEACRSNDLATEDLYLRAQEVINQYIAEVKEDRQEALKKLALIHELAAETLTDRALACWHNALVAIKESVTISPLKAAWDNYFRLVHYPYPFITRAGADHVSIRNTEIEQLKILQKQLLVEHPDLCYQFALSFYQLKKYYEWKNCPSGFPEKEYTEWLNEALDWQPTSINRMDLTEAISFFSNEGERSKRIDLLHKSINLSEQFISKIEDPIFEVYALVRSWRTIANLHLENEDDEKADAALTKAVEVYQRYPVNVGNKPMQTHYLEFLEYCFYYKGNIPKPELATFRSFAEAVEQDEQEYNTRPNMVLIRLAMHEGKEDEAIFFTTKMLVLYELVEEQIGMLLPLAKEAGLDRFTDLLEETLLFFKEIRPNYYLDKEVRWEHLQAMSRDEILKYWEDRKRFLRKRAPLNF